MKSTIELTIDLNHAVMREGFADLSMSALAQAAQVSRATLYNHFKNKEEILQAVVDRHILFIDQTQNQTLEMTPGGYADLRLRSILFLGAASPKFLSDLSRIFSQQSFQLEKATEQFELTVTQGYQDLQQAQILRPELTADDLKLQDQLLVKTMISRIADHQISVKQAMNMLPTYFATQIRGTLVETTAAETAIAKTQPLFDRMVQEFYATYGTH